MIVVTSFYLLFMLLWISLALMAVPDEEGPTVIGLNEMRENIVGGATRDG